MLFTEIAFFCMRKLINNKKAVCEWRKISNVIVGVAGPQ
jgi:hypothetical protein